MDKSSFFISLVPGIRKFFNYFNRPEKPFIHIHLLDTALPVFRTGRDLSAAEIQRAQALLYEAD
ncbi:MAG: hypothetical protein R3E95_23850, partial [Thiolinea sp.]